MKSSLFAISIPVAISILSKYRGSRSVDETMFDIIVEDEDLKEQAEAAHSARKQNIPIKTVKPTSSRAHSKATKMGFILQNWRTAIFFQKAYPTYSPTKKYPPFCSFIL